MPRNTQVQEAETEFFDDPEGQGYAPDDAVDREADEVFGQPSAPDTAASGAAKEAPQVRTRAQRQQPTSPVAAPAPAPVAAAAPAQRAASPVVQPPQQQTQAIEPAKPQRPPMKMGDRGLEVTDLGELYRMADIFAKSTMVPKTYQGNPSNVMVAMMWGRELGLTPMASLTGIAVINDTPSVWGDALPGLCYAAKDANGQSLVEDHIEEWEGEGMDMVAICKVKRRGQTSYHEERFSMQDAQRAGLLNKQTYKAYPKRMCMNRARAFAFRTKFADVLRGLAIAEEVQDIPVQSPSTQPAPTSEPKFSADLLEETAV